MKWYDLLQLLYCDIRRSPHGERGLKLMDKIIQIDGKESLPARGAWIEIFARTAQPCAAQRRSPHGERGLKYYIPRRLGRSVKSLPARGAWIEIHPSKWIVRAGPVAPRTGSVD